MERAIKNTITKLPIHKAHNLRMLSKNNYLTISILNNLLQSRNLIRRHIQTNNLIPIIKNRSTISNLTQPNIPFSNILSDKHLTILIYRNQMLNHTVIRTFLLGT